MADRMRLGDILVGRGVITDDQLGAALAWRQVSESRERLGDTIIRLGYITELDLAEALAQQLGLASEDLAHLDVEPEVAALVPAEVATESQVLPLRIEDGTLVVAMVDPTDIILLDELRLRTGHRSPRPVVVTAASCARTACASPSWVSPRSRRSCASPPRTPTCRAASCWPASSTTGGARRGSRIRDDPVASPPPA